jgi:hypothetical protein
MRFQGITMRWRSLFGRAERKRPATARRVQPTLQGLEDRDLKSTGPIPSGVIMDDVVDVGSAVLFPPGPCSPAAQVAPKMVPFKESLTLVSVTPTGPNTFTDVLTGNATHMGRVTVTANGEIDPTTGIIHLTFTRVAANGDTMFGTTVLIPTGETTGPIATVTDTTLGGTGRFEGVTGIASGLVFLDPDTGVQTVEVEGTMSSVGSLQC